MTTHKPNRPLLPATATVSLGKPDGHSLESILQAAAKAGLKGIEICYNNLLNHSAQLSGFKTSDLHEEAILAGARDVKRRCDELGLTIIVLQPFASYDGLVDDEQHDRMLYKFKQWLEIANALGCDIVQMPSNPNSSGTTDDLDKIVADIVEVADLAAKENPPVRIAYEALAWGAHVDLWEQSWEIVKRADRANVGLCLDTYHIAARVWADPASESGMAENHNANLVASIQKLVQEVDVSKVFYVQLSDAEKLDAPLVEGHEFYDPSQPARMSWSRNARLFPCEETLGGCMPVLTIAQAIVNSMGYRGWISMELFSRHLLKDDPGIPAEFAWRAMRSYRKAREKLGWDGLVGVGKYRD